MSKLVAVTCTIAWIGFWAFGYLAITADGFSAGQLVTSTLLAALGMLTGVFSYLHLSRGVEPREFAGKIQKLDAAVCNRAQQQGGI
ncbi:hypothetical protein DL239_13290 [Sedimentitalea sp. CY04]|uniref:Uncharacterized protein n=1 Tax=Parasedimentitalea denitrificans TaxID=2211118 RepID=A0ABX0WCB3_9RHOB|nr:hypothetical protein [Sedimentitalea sp. CY04]NIZ61950.1 hypothetical protein [Sedimentitalea sp. CY04]